MDIKQAKQQLCSAVRAYLSRDERGLPRVPRPMQRPVLMMGPPGVGKTAVVAQVAEELGINFVSYSITHHTRQTALGLPFIVEREFGGRAYQVSEYTMSEIIGAVHQARERSGVAEGILFLDEVNCVSETLAPAMLQFLQYKTFGQHALPDGWVIVCAGNPPAYNRAARDFDPAMLDRLKRLDVEPNLEAWLEYAPAAGIHPAILDFLQAKPDSFYMVRAGINGMRMVTARGWEDLSRMLLAYEAEQLAVDEALVRQYLQDDEIAQDFAVHYELYCTYRDGYDVPAILSGTRADDAVSRAAAADFAERMTITGLLADAVRRRVRESVELEEALKQVRSGIVRLKPLLETGDESVPARIRQETADFAETPHANGLPGAADAVGAEVARVWKEAGVAASRALAQGESAYGAVRDAFNAECQRQSAWSAAAESSLEAAYGFIDAAFGGQSMEAVVCTARLAADAAVMRHVVRFRSAAFLAHNKELLVNDRTRELLRELG